MKDDNGLKKESTGNKIQEQHKSRTWLTPPEPIRRVFNRFPLIKLDENTFPQRARYRDDENVLFIFTIDADTASTNLSCNPACLRWQAYLKIKGIPFSVRKSNNHASPSGALPFLIPAQDSYDSVSPIPSNKLSKWMRTKGMKEENINLRQETYTTLIEQNIRNAWLYTLYLEPENFQSVARPLYILPSSSNRFVQMALAYQLRGAAEQELLKSRDIIDRDVLYAAADKAFQALSTLLGDSDYFSGEDSPGLFDASVFAYTHLLLSTKLQWQNKKLKDILEKYPRLIDHQNAVLEICLRE